MERQLKKRGLVHKRKTRGGQPVLEKVRGKKRKKKVSEKKKDGSGGKHVLSSPKQAFWEGA